MNNFVNKSVNNREEKERNEELEAQASDLREMNKWLHASAITGDVETLRRLLAEGANVEGDAEDDESPLALAAGRGHVEALRLLLEAGADVEGCAHCGSSALYEAASGNSLECVRLLLEHGASARESLGPCWQTPLEAAARNDNIPMAQLLLEYGADVNAPDGDGDITPLMEAADNAASAEMVRFLLAQGAELEARDCSERTALLFAVARGSWDAVDALLEAGADIYAASHRGGSAMACAAEEDDEALALCLREYGWCAQKEPSPCLHIAAAFGSRRMVELLLEWGMPLEAQDAQGYTAFDRAVGNGRADMARLLERFGASRHGAGRPAGVNFLLAAWEGNLRTLSAEIAAGVDINTRLEPTRMTALHAAVTRDDAELLRLLLTLGADVEAVALWSRTPLLQAVTENKEGLVRLLLKSGGRLMVGEGWDFRNALTLAVRERRLPLVRLILESGAADKRVCENCWLDCYASFSPGEVDAEIVGLLLDAGVSPWLRRCPGALTLIDYMLPDRLPEIARELRARGYDWQSKDALLLHEMLT